MIKEYRNNDGIENGAHMILAVEDDEALLLLLLDYCLPDMTGKQVVETLAEQQRSIPFIVITGHGDEKVAVGMNCIRGEL
jgi:FixJ family two-component response regulator